MLASMPERLQRARGLLRLEVAERAGRTHVARLRQQGCLKLLFPRTEPGAALQAASVNCSGGIAAGDRLESRIVCAAGTHLLLTSQAAERCYRARAGESAAEVDAHARLDSGARLEWLPQETILFDGASLRRRLTVEMADDASLLCVESRVFGRAGSGERLRRLDLSDRLLVRRGGVPILVDGFELHGDAEAALSRAAVAAGARASAAIVLVAPDAEALLDPVRDALAGADAGASSWNGMLRIVMVSRDPAAHRTRIAALLSVLRGGDALPSVWRC